MVTVTFAKCLINIINVVFKNPQNVQLKIKKRLYTSTFNDEAIRLVTKTLRPPSCIAATTRKMFVHLYQLPVTLRWCGPIMGDIAAPISARLTHKRTKAP